MNLKTHLCLLTPRYDEVVIIAGSVFFAGERVFGGTSDTPSNTGIEPDLSGTERCPAVAVTPRAAAAHAEGASRSTGCSWAAGASAFMRRRPAECPATIWFPLPCARTCTEIQRLFYHFCT